MKRYIDYLAEPVNVPIPRIALCLFALMLGPMMLNSYAAIMRFFKP